MQWLILQQDKPEDFVIATGTQYCVRDFVNAAADELSMKIRWEGRGVEETGTDRNGKVIVWIDPRYFRPTEVETLLGDPTKARRNWDGCRRLASRNWWPKWCAKTSKPPSGTSWTRSTASLSTLITSGARTINEQ